MHAIPNAGSRLTIRPCRSRRRAARSEETTTPSDGRRGSGTGSAGWIVVFSVEVGEGDALAAGEAVAASRGEGSSEAQATKDAAATSVGRSARAVAVVLIP